ncbi:unnamed protein product [Symbiodinium natans]|uniref:Uncharacterized protein n=1 Tax=Symbiodinium natans TaxID=878477 RepID=A0A812UAZ7_9DINO|nr:unnamed protein product [Symbiodinium natans]
MERGFKSFCRRKFQAMPTTLMLRAPTLLRASSAQAARKGSARMERRLMSAETVCCCGWHLLIAFRSLNLGLERATNQAPYGSKYAGHVRLIRGRGILSEGGREWRVPCSPVACSCLS